MDAKQNFKKENLVLVLTMTTTQEKLEGFFAEHAILLLVMPKIVLLFCLA